jgi:hypothetical protein
MEQGWIYVLVNSSIPGLIKVGRTTRLPAERAAELSASTGVATPFVVAFEQPCADCAAMERAVHAELDRRGLRAAANREFFRGSTTDIVRVVLACASPQDAAPEDRPHHSALELLANGDRHLFGHGETLQDLAEAVRYYKLARRRGSLVALERLGVIYLHTHTKGGADRRRAIGVLKEGAGRGNYFCYCELAVLFAREGHLRNFAKAWDLFFAARHRAICPEVEQGGERYPRALRAYIAMCLDLRLAPAHTAALRAAVDVLVAGLLTAIDLAAEMPELRHRMVVILRWTHDNLLSQPQPHARTSPPARRPSGRVGRMVRMLA